MNDQSRKLSQPTLPGLSNVIFSAAYSAGPPPCGSPDGMIPGLFGRVPVPVSRSRRQANGKGDGTAGIFGPLSADSSQSASPMWSSVSKWLPPTPSGRLQARLGRAIIRRILSPGSMVYKQVWRVRVTPSGFTFLAHTASARTTSDKGCSGSQTPMTSDTSAKKHHQERSDGGQPNLAWEANLAGWPTPNAMEGGSTSRGGDRKDELLIGGLVKGLAGWPTPNVPNRGAESRESKDVRGAGGLDLQTTAALAGWATPAARDEKGIDQNYCKGEINNSLPNQAAALGTTPSSSPAATASSGVLSPAFPRWLMGFPEAWDKASPGYAEWERWQKHEQASAKPNETAS